MVLGRRLSPGVSARFPALAARVTPLPPLAPPAAPGGEADSGADPTVGPPGHAEVLASPARPPLSRRTVVTALIGVVALALAVVGFKVIGSRFYGPEATAKAYLADVSAGDVNGALSHLSVRPSDRTLLTSAALPVAARITQPHVGAVHRSGDLASVDVTYVVGGQRHEDTLTLVHSGRRGGVFHDWSVRDGLGELSVDTNGSLTTLTLNGVQVSAGDSHPALPGVYEIAIDDELLTSDIDSAVMTFANISENVQAELSAAAEQKATDAVTAYFTQCLARATTLTTACGFSSYQFADRFEGVRWTLDPVDGLTLSYDDGEVSVSGSVGAHVTGTAVSSDFLGGFTREPIDDSDEQYVSGAVTFTGGVARYEP
jgi:hypothetical protein